MWDKLKLNYQAGNMNSDIQRNSFSKGLGQWQLKIAVLQGFIGAVEHGWLPSSVKCGWAILPPSKEVFRRNSGLRNGILDQSYTEVCLKELFFK